MTRAQLLREMAMSELVEWSILESVEPFGEFGHYLRSAVLITLIKNIFNEKDKPPHSIEEALPQTFRSAKPASPVQSPATMKAIMMMVKAHQDAWLASRKKAMEREPAADVNNSGA